MTNDNPLPKRPLISVIAVSFRSAQTIESTLESIANQTYQRLELIICDDDSDDETVAIAKRWLQENHRRFERVSVAAQPKNVGIVKNYDTGLHWAQGDWIKPIACDDMLYKHALETYMKVAASTSMQWAFSQCSLFSETQGEHIELGELVPERTACLLQRGDHAALQERLLRSNILPAPSAFFHRDLLIASGGLDKRFRNLDDWPLWVRSIDAGYFPYWIDEPLIKYRVGAQGVTNQNKLQAVKPGLFKDERTLFRHYQSARLPALESWDIRVRHWQQWLAYRCFANSAKALKLLSPMLLLSPLCVFRKMHIATESSTQ
ncbi:MAG: glycosyltransferase [Rubrivivax sp.]